MSDAIIRLQDVNKWYGQFHVLRNINLDVAPGERIVVCGPSGSGKSTMIRCINRLEEHQKGHIIVDGTELTNDLKHIETIRKDVGMVFQHFNLFPHLTVLENCTLAPMLVKAESGPVPATGETTTAASLALQFDQYQRSQGVLAVPEGFVPESVTISVLEGDVVRASRSVKLEL